MNQGLILLILHGNLIWVRYKIDGFIPQLDESADVRWAPQDRKIRAMELKCAEIDRMAQECRQLYVYE
jgi:hypothetical protein